MTDSSEDAPTLSPASQLVDTDDPFNLRGVADPTPALRPLRMVTAEGRAREDEAQSDDLGEPGASIQPQESGADRAARRREVVQVMLAGVGVLSGTAAGFTVSVTAGLAVLAVLALGMLALVVFE